LKKKGLMPIRGYYTRAKVFGYLMIAVAIGYILFYILREYFN
jgi:hypothetical protein